MQALRKLKYAKTIAEQCKDGPDGIIVDPPFSQEHIADTERYLVNDFDAETARLVAWETEFHNEKLRKIKLARAEARISLRGVPAMPAIEAPPPDGATTSNGGNSDGGSRAAAKRNAEAIPIDDDDDDFDASRRAGPLVKRERNK